VLHDPANGPAWQSLQDLAVRRGDWQAAAFCLEKRAALTDGPRRKAQLYVELAAMRQEKDDAAGARAAYEAAIAADVTNEVAANAMLGHYLDRSRWADAAPLCDVLVNAATRDGDPDRAFGYLRLATRIASELGNGERAVTSAVAALKWREDDAEAIEELVLACHPLRDQVKALARAREPIERIGKRNSSLPPSSMAKLGDLQRAFGDEPAAVQTYLGAIELDEADPIALAGLAEAYAARGRWRDACVCKERLAHAAADPDDRHAKIMLAAEAWMERARDPDMAAQAYEWAHTWRPSDRSVLHALLAVYTERERWSDVARTLRSLADLETDRTDLKAKTVYAMAQVVREKMDDAPHAAILFEEALDLEPSRLEAFERLVRLHTESRDWEALGAAYLRMIERVGAKAKPELLFLLFFQLGLVCRDRLGDAAGALAAFSRARAIKPEDDQSRRIVTELYVVTDQLDKAIQETRASLLVDPLAPAAYHELYALFLRQHAYDKAWCVADALADLGACNAEQAGFLGNYPPSLLANIPGKLRPSAWSTHLSHPRLDATLTSIYARMIPAVLRARIQALAAGDRQALLGMPVDAPRNAVEHAVLAGLHHAAEILGHPVPALSRKAGPVPLAVGHSLTPAMVLSPDAAAAIPPATLAFFIGKRLAEQRPALLARAFFPSATELATILQTAIRLTRGTPSPQAPEAGESDGLAARFDALVLSGLSDDDRAELPKAVAALHSGGATTADPAVWSQSADLTTTRAGLLLAGSVAVAHRAMLLENHYASDLAPRERIKELLMFAVSDTYSELRGALGISVETAMQR
jgi:tetratricopeptide (TPR) repeat protein